MTQITGSLSFANVKLEVSNDGFSADTKDISGALAAVTVSGGDRQLAEEYTADGDTAIITAGKRDPVEVTCRIVYTEGATDAFEHVRTEFEPGDAYYVRWSPKGGAGGDFRFTSDAGKIRSMGYPQGEVSGGAPMMFEFTVRTPKLTKAAI